MHVTIIVGKPCLFLYAPTLFRGPAHYSKCTTVLSSSPSLVVFLVRFHLTAFALSTSYICTLVAWLCCSLSAWRFYILDEL